MLRLLRAGERTWLRLAGCRVPRSPRCASASSRCPLTGCRCRPGWSPCGASSRSAWAWPSCTPKSSPQRPGWISSTRWPYGRKTSRELATPRPRPELRCGVGAVSPGGRKAAGAPVTAASAPQSGEEPQSPSPAAWVCSAASVRTGGVAHGPRGPTSYYYMLPMKVRVLGLKVALTIKLAQDSLHIVDSLELPTADPQYLTDLARYRRWGDSVLLVDAVYEEMPQNVVAATSGLKTFTLIPAVGLNVHSMLKHETLVLTLRATTFLEEKLLWHSSRYTPLYPFRLPYSDFP
ncbi:large ribosomal subunit protein uL4m isoform X3 [Tamandua tetradactyla]|uniref:large ribosomal subunit protein uL4m isoform X3 n=1 Tax=Tamandua tetradactyla TaxID=48850 RepID=UPI0040549EAB